MTTILTRIQTNVTTTALTLAGAAAIAVIALSAPAQAVDPANPDWPCVQRKILTITPSQIWDGPAITDAMPWRNSNEIRNLVKVLMARRISVEDAEKAIGEYAKSLPEDKRGEHLTLLFAGFLDQTNARRSKVVKGVEKINLRQRARAKELERQGVELAAMHDSAQAGEKGMKAKIAEAEKAYDWDARVYKERQENIPLACEIPVLIEQRAFALARAIRAQMKD